MSAEITPNTPSDVFARRVRDVRKSRGWSQRQLAERLSELDYATDRTAVNRIETGKRADVRLSDVFAFALALDVMPVHLIVPLEDEAPVAVTPARVVGAPAARAWIRGERLLRGADPRAVFAQFPESEQRAILDGFLTRGMDSIGRALTLDQRQATIEEMLSSLREEDDEWQDPQPGK